LEIQGDRLIVNGQVTLPFKKQDIGNFLAHDKGVADLENNLEVLPTSEYDDSLRFAVARAIYNDPYFIHYRDQALPPIHIIVKNGNVTLEGVVLNPLDRAKAEADARLAATFFNFTDNLRVESK
jgi:hyperosmotically inducible protein